MLINPSEDREPTKGPNKEPTKDEKLALEPLTTCCAILNFLANDHRPSITSGMRNDLVMACCIAILSDTTLRTVDYLTTQAKELDCCSDAVIVRMLPHWSKRSKESLSKLSNLIELLK